MSDDQIAGVIYDNVSLAVSLGKWPNVAFLATPFSSVLKAFQIATTALCEEQNISISLIYPVIYSLLKNHL